MSAPVRRQSTPLLAPTTPQGNGNRQLADWASGATLAGSRLGLFVGILNNLTDGIGVTVAGYSQRRIAIRQATAHDSVTLRWFHQKSAAAAQPAPTLAFTGMPAGGCYIWAKAFEITGDDSALDEDPGVAELAYVGNDAAFSLGPEGPTTRAEGLWLGATATPNIQVAQLAAGSPFNQVSAGNSGGSGDSAKITALIAELAQSAIGTAQMDVEIAGAIVRQHAGLLIFIPGPTTGGGGGGGGGTGAPLSFPLGPPDMTGAVTIPDPGIAAPAQLDQPWAPNLANGTKYILNAPQQRHRALRAIGGNHVYVPKLLIRANARDPELVKLGGGDVGRIVHIDTCVLDPNGFECDGIKTSLPFSGRHLQIRTMYVYPLIGSTDPVLPDFPNGVHADLLQSSGGIGDVWIQDLVSFTTYQGLQLQREAKLGPGAAFTITSWSRSGTTLTINAAGHGLTNGKFVSHHGAATAAIQGGFKVTSATSGSYTVELTSEKAALLGASGSGGTGQEMTFAYDVGSLHVLRWHMIGLPNASGNPARALGMLRIGARTAPVNNSHPNEDQTRLTNDAWDGTATFSEVYGEPPAGVSLAQFIKPDNDAANWSTIKSDLATAPTPDDAGWANWAKVTGRIKLGPPPQEFVVLQGGVPFAPLAGSGGGTITPAPTNTTPPVIQPPDPSSVDTLFVGSLGSWSDTNSSTVWTVRFQRQLGTSGGYTNKVTLSGLTEAQAAAATYLLNDTDIGYQYRITVQPDNGTPATAANSLPTSVVTEPFSVSIEAVVE